MGQDFLVPLEGPRLGWGVCPYMLGEKASGVGHCRPDSRDIGRLYPGSAGDEFAYQLISLAALRFQGLTGRVASALATAVPAVIPFYKVVPRSAVPHVAASRSVERDEFPDALRKANLLDDPDPLVGRTTDGRSVFVDAPRLLGDFRCWEVHGVYFLGFTDTKRLGDRL